MQKMYKKPDYMILPACMSATTAARLYTVAYWRFAD